MPKKRFHPGFKILSVVSVVCLAVSGLHAQGKFELNFHYGAWTLDVIRGAIEDTISESMEEGFKEAFLEEIQAEHPDFVESMYRHDINFDSSGNNFGFELRWYPKGYEGSFSLGLVVEKLTMRIGFPEVSARLELEDQVTHETASFSGTVQDAEFEMKPLAFLLNFRWDIKPSWRVRPFLTLGFGMAGGGALEEATVGYSFSGDLVIPGEPPESYQESDTKTIKEIKDEAENPEDVWLPSVIPFFQLNLGLKVVLTDNFHALVEFGVLDGFVFRGGISARF